MTDDIVAALEVWLTARRTAENAHAFAPIGELLHRARDEILALRKQLEAVKGIAGNERKLSEAIIQQARDEALEEAVQACTDQTSDDPLPGTYNDACEDCAAAIRALKERR